MLDEEFDLALGVLRSQRHEQIGMAEVTLELGDLVLGDQVIAERVPGQLADEPVILVEIRPATVRWS